MKLFLAQYQPAPAVEPMTLVCRVDDSGAEHWDALPQLSFEAIYAHQSAAALESTVHALLPFSTPIDGSILQDSGWLPPAPSHLPVFGEGVVYEKSEKFRIKQTTNVTGGATDHHYGNAGNVLNPLEVFEKGLVHNFVTHGGEIALDMEPLRYYPNATFTAAGYREETEFTAAVGAAPAYAVLGHMIGFDTTDSAMERGSAVLLPRAKRGFGPKVGALSHLLLVGGEDLIPPTSEMTYQLVRDGQPVDGDTFLLAARRRSLAEQVREAVNFARRDAENGLVLLTGTGVYLTEDIRPGDISKATNPLLGELAVKYVAS